MYILYKFFRQISYINKRDKQIKFEAKIIEKRFKTLNPQSLKSLSVKNHEDYVYILLWKLKTFW